MSNEFETIVRLMQGTKAQYTLGTQLAQHYQAEFEAYFGYDVATFTYLEEAIENIFVEHCKGEVRRNLFDNKFTLQHFAHEHLDMYEPRLPDDVQCTGWHVLKQMVLKQVETPPEYHLALFHANLRPYIKNRWNFIKELKVL